MTKDKNRVQLECSQCGQELIASPGMADYALAGKGVCVKCGGRFVRPAHVVTGRHAERPRRSTLYICLHMKCGKCRKAWDQPGIDPRDPGWLVCPHCNYAAPTEEAA